MSPSEAIRDATGRLVRVGDTVGGTTSGRYQATIVGPVLRIGKGQVKVRVTGPAGDGAYRPKAGDEKWISAYRVFLVKEAAGAAFRAKVLREAASVADALCDQSESQLKEQGIIGPYTAFGHVAEELRRMAEGGA